MSEREHVLRLNYDDNYGSVFVACAPCGWQKSLGYDPEIGAVAAAADLHDHEQEVRVVERWSSGPPGVTGPAGEMSRVDVEQAIRRMVRPEALL